MIGLCRRVIVSGATLLAVSIGCLGIPLTFAQTAPDYVALMAAPDRSDADRAADKRRDPVPFLAFAGLMPGMKVLDMGAGAGYSTELVARVIGPTGTVYGQNPPDNFERARNAFATRAATPSMRNSVAVVKPYDDPLPANVHDLDMVTYLFFYHDTTYLNVDRAQMNRKLFEALKPGGTLVIADHSAKAGARIRLLERLFIASMKACSAVRSRRLALSWWPKAISGVTLATRAISQRNSRRVRSITSY
jgi:predicted methyltransferase